MAQNNIPKHIGYIVDGNRRWAKANGLKSVDGHKKGFEVFKEIAESTFGKGVEYVSAYIFSTENWKRSAEEVGYLMKLFENYFDKEIKDLHEKNIRVVFSGNRTKNVSGKLIQLMNQGEELTKDNTGGTLCLCFNYGGQLEIVEAAQTLAQKVAEGSLRPIEITVDKFAEYLYHPSVPAIDVMVRTSGEQRISNFQLWRMAYSEMIFLDKAWPEMEESDVDFVLGTYAGRDRRMGGDTKK
ncbi:MAG: di-trans,poly-cis-decaprenylcistransferase [Candidatus Sacchiramonaceae bacterium]|nr:di-trans,poly-cis-decaprenylcistransferase [Candidatus Saccharimonadaceae bacterium]